MKQRVVVLLQGVANRLCRQRRQRPLCLPGHCLHRLTFWSWNVVKGLSHPLRLVTSYLLVTSSTSYVIFTISFRCRRICLQTFILPPSMVAISAHLHIDHSLFHGLEPPSVTEVSLSQDRAFGTVCWLLSDRSPATDSLLSLGDI